MVFSKFIVILSWIFIVACSNTVSPDGESNALDGESSSVKKSSDSKPSSSSVVSDEQCEGESGRPWDGTTAKNFACGTGTKLNPYVIRTAEQLSLFSFVIGAKDDNYLEKYYRLDADILLNAGKIINDKGDLIADSTELHKWIPVGNSSVAFSGNFDGNGHSIQGLFINTTSSHNGLFGNVSGIVQNLGVKNSWISGGKNTAGIAGVLAGSGVVKNVENGAAVTGTECVSGIVATASWMYDKTVSIVDAKNFGVIKGNRFVAGIIAYTSSGVSIKNVENHNLVEGTYGVGGIVGHLGTTSNMESAWNDGEIVGGVYTAGIAGYFGYSYCPSNKNYGTIKQAMNRGLVTGTKYTAGIVGQGECVTIETSANKGNIEGTLYVAGVSGHAKRSTMKSLYNMGNVVGTSRIGGLIGCNEEGVSRYAYSKGTVDGDSLVGLVIGYNYNTTMADFYYLEQRNLEPFGLNNSGGNATSRFAEEMQTADFAELLGEDFVYDSKQNDSFPILAWE